MPSSDTDSFIKITCDWQRTCNRFFPTTKQIIDDSLFSVTDYCWVYLGVRMFCIRVVILMLSSVLTSMYAVIKRFITNHNMWPIFSINISLSVHSYFRLFLLHGRPKGNRSNRHLKPVYRGLHTRVHCLLRQGTRFITLSISRGHFFWLEIIFEITHKVHPMHASEKLGVLWAFGLFLIITCPPVLFPIPH